MSKTIRASVRMVLAVVALVCVWLASESAAVPVKPTLSTAQLLGELNKPGLKPDKVAILLSMTKQENQEDEIIGKYKVGQLREFNSVLTYRNCALSELERRADICLELDMPNDSENLKNNLYNYCKDRLANLVNYCRTYGVNFSLDELINNGDS